MSIGFVSLKGLCPPRVCKNYKVVVKESFTAARISNAQRRSPRSEDRTGNNDRLCKTGAKGLTSPQMPNLQNSVWNETRSFATLCRRSDMQTILL